MRENEEELKKANDTLEEIQLQREKEKEEFLLQREKEKEEFLLQREKEQEAFNSQIAALKHQNIQKEAQISELKQERTEKESEIKNLSKRLREEGWTPVSYKKNKKQNKNRKR